MLRQQPSKVPEGNLDHDEDPNFFLHDEAEDIRPDLFTRLDGRTSDGKVCPISQFVPSFLW
jgi:hypothetical protein